MTNQNNQINSEAEAEQAIESLLASIDNASKEISNLSTEISGLDAQVSIEIENAKIASQTFDTEIKNLNKQSIAEFDKLALERSQELADEEADTAKFL